MPNTIVKLEKERQNLIAAAEAISLSHKKLLEELPVFFSKRIDYIQPTLQVLDNDVKCYVYFGSDKYGYSTIY